MGHCIASVYVNSYERHLNTMANNSSVNDYNMTSPKTSLNSKKEQQHRGMWIHDRVFSKEEIARGKEFKEGFYLFGG